MRCSLMWMRCSLVWISCSKCVDEMYSLVENEMPNEDEMWLKNCQQQKSYPWRLLFLTHYALHEHCKENFYKKAFVSSPAYNEKRSWRDTYSQQWWSLDKDSKKGLHIHPGHNQAVKWPQGLTDGPRWHPPPPLFPLPSPLRSPSNCKVNPWGKKPGWVPSTSSSITIINIHHCPPLPPPQISC